MTCMTHTDVTGLASPGDQPNTHYRVISLTYHTRADSLLLILFFPLPTYKKRFTLISCLIGYCIPVCPVWTWVLSISAVFHWGSPLMPGVIFYSMLTNYFLLTEWACLWQSDSVSRHIMLIAVVRAQGTVLQSSNETWNWWNREGSPGKAWLSLWANFASTMSKSI